MVVDNIKDIDKYSSLHKDFAIVFDYLKNLQDVSLGKTILDEGNVWFNAMEIKELAGGPRLFEAHREFIDIHYVLSGEEEFGYSNIDYLTSVQTYDSDSDCEMLEGGINKIVLKQGDFVITFPEDAHIPYLRMDDKSKLVHVVAKIRV